MVSLHCNVVVRGELCGQSTLQCCYERGEHEPGLGWLKDLSLFHLFENSCAVGDCFCTIHTELT